MQGEQDYIRDITEIRSMMERSSKFLSLSGWAGIMAGLYALCGAYIAYKFFYFTPGEIAGSASPSGSLEKMLPRIIFLAIAILIVAASTATYFSYRNATKQGEKLWNHTTRQLLISMMIPLTAGGILVLILISQGLIGLSAPLTLIFYGLALYNASKFTIDEVKILGFIEICLGLISTLYFGYGLLFWAIGFGIAHIVYGIYMHFKYER